MLSLSHRFRRTTRQIQELEQKKKERKEQWAREMLEEEMKETQEQKKARLIREAKQEKLQHTRVFKVKGGKKKSQFGEDSTGPALADMLRRVREEQSGETWPALQFESEEEPRARTIRSTAN